MKRITTISLVMFAFFAFAILLYGCQVQVQPGAQEKAVEEPKEPKVSEGHIKIGVLFPLTGDATAYGLPMQTSTQIAIDEINAEGGVNGRQLQPIYEDGKCNPKDAVGAVQKLVNIDKVEVVLGGVCSGETLGAAPIAENDKVVMLSPSATSPDITTAGDFIFRTAPSDAFAGKVAAEVALEKFNADTAAVMSETTDYSQGLRRVFKEGFENGNGVIVADETFATEDSDFRTQILKVKDAKPDIIYLAPQTPAKGILLIKQIKEAGLSQQLLTAEVLIGRDIVAENAIDMEGIVGIEPAFDENSAKAASFLAKYRDRTGEEPPFPFFMAAAYDSVYLVKQAIEKNGYNGEGIRDFLYTVKDWEGVIGKLTIDENGDPILDASVKQVKNGGLVDFE